MITCSSPLTSTVYNPNTPMPSGKNHIKHWAQQGQHFRRETPTNHLSIIYPMFLSVTFYGVFCPASLCSKRQTDPVLFYHYCRLQFCSPPSSVTALFYMTARTHPAPPYHLHHLQPTHPPLYCSSQTLTPSQQPKMLKPIPPVIS